MSNGHIFLAVISVIRQSCECHLQKLDYYYSTYAEVLVSTTGASWDLCNGQSSIQVSKVTEVDLNCLLDVQKLGMYLEWQQKCWNVATAGCYQLLQ